MVGGHAHLPALLHIVSVAFIIAWELMQLTYTIILTESDESEADRNHARMDRECNGLVGILELAPRGFGQARRHEDGEGARAERIPGGVW